METLACVTSRGLRLTVEVPSTRRERTRGLLGRDAIDPGRAMLFVRARSVHTVRMRFRVLVAYVDEEWRVVEVRSVPPGRVPWPRWGARHVLELEDGADMREGDRLLADEGPDQSEHGERRQREGDDERRGDQTDPRGERDGLTPVRVRPADPEELQQRTHG